MLSVTHLFADDITGGCRTVSLGPCPGSPARKNFKDIVARRSGLVDNGSWRQTREWRRAERIYASPAADFYRSSEHGGSVGRSSGVSTRFAEIATIKQPKSSGGLTSFSFGSCDAERAAAQTLRTPRVLIAEDAEPLIFFPPRAEPAAFARARVLIDPVGQ